MEPERFDQATKLLTTAVSRRGAAAVITALTAAGLPGLDDADAKK